MTSVAALRALLRRQWRALRRRPIGLRAVAVGPDRVFADSVDRYVAALAWKLGLRDGPARRLIGREVQAGMVAVDVGANLGWYSLALARRVGAEGRVYAIEPEPGNVELLTRALGGGRLPQVEIRQVAAADYSGWMTLYLGESDRGDHRIFPAAGERRRLTVRAVSLDDLLAAAPRVDLIKLSVQGAEVSVLRGLRQTLARQPDLRLLCSVAPALLARAGAGADALFGPLR
ncbi:MAG: FkbM family methyltransferase, partial [Candidatus Binatia bacterium]